MKNFVQPRPNTRTPEDVVMALVYAVRDQFYRDDQRAAFYPQLKDLKRVVTWPAAWFNERAIFVDSARYQAIMLAIFRDIKRNGDTGGVTYWPRYLMTCVQRHFRFNADLYVEEGKSVRDAADRALRGLPTPIPAGTPPLHFIAVAAEAHRLLKSPGGRRRCKPVAACQPTLF